MLWAVPHLAVAQPLAPLALALRLGRAAGVAAATTVIGPRRAVQGGIGGHGHAAPPILLEKTASNRDNLTQCAGARGAAAGA